MSEEDLQEVAEIVEDEEIRRPQPDSSAFGLLPAELLEEAREVFGMFSDGAGQMNVRHLYNALRSVGVDATDNDVMAIVEAHDPDGRGYMQLGQWTVALARRLAEDVDRRKRFGAQLAAGAASGGQVTVGHARAVIETFDPAATTDADTAYMVDSANYAGLGLIDYDNFMATMVRPARLEP